MAADGKLDLWKTVVGVGAGLIAIGASVLSARHDLYGLILLIGGLLLVGLGLALAIWQQHEWRRPPRLPRGATCSHFPTKFLPKLFPDHPHLQELAVGLDRTMYPPDFRVFCSAPIRNIEASLIEIPPTGEPRTITRYHTAIDAVSINFPPLQPINPPAVIHLSVFSDEPIRVRRIKKVNPEYKQTKPSAGPAPTRASE